MECTCMYVTGNFLASKIQASPYYTSMYLIFYLICTVIGTPVPSGRILQRLTLKNVGHAKYFSL